MKPVTLSILTGILIGTSYIPLPPWAVFFCFLPLWIAWMEARSLSEIFWTGWLAQFVLTAIGFNWVAHTVHEFGHLPWAAAVLVLFLFCSLANIYLPLAGVGWFYFCRAFKVEGLSKIWALPIFVCILERIVPQIFDWHFGYTWLWARLPGFHLADIVGFAGLSSLGILANGFLLHAWWQGQHGRSWWRMAAVTPLLFVALNVAGYFHGLGKGQTDKSLRFLLVQANIGNQDKLAAETGGAYREVVLNRFAAETRAGLEGAGPVDFVVWPETAFPDLIESAQLAYGFSARLKAFIQSVHTPLITGGYSHHGRKYGNSFFIMGENGEWLAPPYDKTMLLAFGEFMPMGNYFPLLHEWFPEVGDLYRGPGPQTMRLNGGLRIGPQICYEGLFDWFARGLANQGAQVIVNLTNDSWYGTWEEPFQHGFMTLARAVEVRRPMVRSTNTGLSAVALANGDILPLSPLHKEWFHLYEVKYASNPEVTAFMSWGYWLIPVLLGLGLCLISIRSIRKK